MHCGTERHRKPLVIEKPEQQRFPMAHQAISGSPSAKSEFEEVLEGSELTSTQATFSTAKILHHFYR